MSSLPWLSGDVYEDAFRGESPAVTTENVAAGLGRARGLARSQLRTLLRARPFRACSDAILFGREGTLVTRMPLSGDLERLHPMPGAADAVAPARAAGVAVGA